MNSYLFEHRQNRYLPEEKSLAGLLCCTNKAGWRDWYIGRNILFSHRITDYSINIFPEKLHAHEFYEMDIYISGKISFVSGSEEIFPERNDILIIPPGCTHTARLLEAGQYERYVFYFSTVVFKNLGLSVAPHVFCENKPSCRYITNDARAEFFYVFEKLKHTLSEEMPDAGLLAYSYALQILYLVANGSAVNRKGIAAVPQNVYEVKNYIDHNFQSIVTVTDVANHFFYSREYVSRIFKQYYNINISEYLTMQKIAFAKEQLEKGKSIRYVADLSGFRSMSSFVNSFKACTGTTPSKYKQSGKPDLHEKNI